MTDSRQKKDKALLIQALSCTKPNDFNKLINYLSDDAINAIGECVYNVIFTDLKLDQRKKAMLRKKLKGKCSMHKIRQVATKTEPIFKRRKALKQVGGFLPLLLATALPFIADLIFGRK